MVKTVMITLTVDMPDTELSKAATVTIETRTYAGAVKAIVTHEEEAASGQVTLEGPGLKVKTA